VKHVVSGDARQSASGDGAEGEAKASEHGDDERDASVAPSSDPDFIQNSVLRQPLVIPPATMRWLNKSKVCVCVCVCVRARAGMHLHAWGHARSHPLWYQCWG